jgi:hypothetical protein
MHTLFLISLLFELQFEMIRRDFGSFGSIYLEHISAAGEIGCPKKNREGLSSYVLQSKALQLGA